MAACAAPSATGGPMPRSPAERLRRAGDIFGTGQRSGCRRESCRGRRPVVPGASDPEVASSWQNRLHLTPFQRRVVEDAQAHDVSVAAPRSAAATPRRRSSPAGAGPAARQGRTSSRSARSSSALRPRPGSHLLELRRRLRVLSAAICRPGSGRSSPSVAPRLEI
jgi:hypothetical protein